MTSLKKAFKEIERISVKNIANSLLQLEFHENGTEEELMVYYGWKEPLKEGEREKLIIDTIERLKSEQLILSFITNHKKELYGKYANKNPLRIIDIIKERSIGTSTQQGSGSENVGEESEDRSKRSVDDNTRLGEIGAESSDRSSETGGDEESI